MCCVPTLTLKGVAADGFRQAGRAPLGEQLEAPGFVYRAVVPSSAHRPLHMHIRVE